VAPLCCMEEQNVSEKSFGENVSEMFGSKGGKLAGKAFRLVAIGARSQQGELSTRNGRQRALVLGFGRAELQVKRVWLQRAGPKKRTWPERVFALHLAALQPGSSGVWQSGSPARATLSWRQTREQTLAAANGPPGQSLGEQQQQQQQQQSILFLRTQHFPFACVIACSAEA